MKKKLFLGGLGVLMLIASAWAMGPFMPTILSHSKIVQLKGKVMQNYMYGYGCMRGCGSITLETSSKNVVVYGFGPMWYWNRQNINLPANGEEISVKAYDVNVNGQSYYVAKEIQLANGSVVKLRDDKGFPVWMQYMRNHGMMNGGMRNGMRQNMHNMHNDMMCPGMNNMMNH